MIMFSTVEIVMFIAGLVTGFVINDWLWKRNSGKNKCIMRPSGLYKVMKIPFKWRK